MFIALAAIRGNVDIQGEDRATVHVDVVDGFGTVLGPPIVQRFESTGKVDLFGEFVGGVGKNIPFGQYRLRVGAEGFPSSEKTVVVGSPETWITVGLDFPFEYPRPVITLSGSFTPRNRIPDSARVKLTGVFMDAGAEARVDPQGWFSMSGLVGGDYFLTLIAGSRVINLRVVHVRVSNKPLNIDLRTLFDFDHSNDLPVLK